LPPHQSRQMFFCCSRGCLPWPLCHLHWPQAPRLQVQPILSFPTPTDMASFQRFLCMLSFCLLISIRPKIELNSHWTVHLK
jgi:hypothetical protein